MSCADAALSGFSIRGGFCAIRRVPAPDHLPDVGRYRLLGLPCLEWHGSSPRARNCPTSPRHLGRSLLSSARNRSGPAPSPCPPAWWPPPPQFAGVFSPARAIGCGIAGVRTPSSSCGVWIAASYPASSHLLHLPGLLPEGQILELPNEGALELVELIHDESHHLQRAGPLRRVTLRPLPLDRIDVDRLGIVGP